MLNKNSLQLIKISTLILIFFIIIFTFTNNDQAYAHLIDGKEHRLSGGTQKHKPLKCKPEEKRSKFKRIFCKTKRKNHSLCKEDIHCALIELEKQKQNISDAKAEIDKQKKENIELEKKLGDMAICSDITFNHKTSKSSKLFRAPNNNSLVITKLKKYEEILFISPSSKDKKWYFVLTRANKICNSGYIQQKFVMKKAGEDIIVTGSKLIDIIDPRWKIEDKLIVVNAEGTVSITGVIQEGKIDKIIINEEEEIINDDNTFNYVTFVSKNGSEIRIIGSKNDKKIKELTFKIKIK